MFFFKYIKTLLILGRVSNLPTVWTNVIVAFYFSNSHPYEIIELLYLILGVSLLYTGGMFLNDAFDYSWDKKYSPNRPIPSNQISLFHVWIITFIQVFTGTLILINFTYFNKIILISLLISIFLYNILHKKWDKSFILMGFCRLFVYLGASYEVIISKTSINNYLILIHGILILIYVYGITLMAKEEHLKKIGAYRKISRYFLIAPLFISLFNLDIGTFLYYDKELIYSILYFISSVLIILFSNYLINKVIIKNIHNGISLSIALISIYDAIFIFHINDLISILCIFLFLITLILQKFIPAT